MRYKLRKHLFQPCSLLTFILLKSDVVGIQNLLSQFYCKNPVIAVHFGTKCAIFLSTIFLQDENNCTKSYK